jgi:hypothetical protein
VVTFVLPILCQSTTVFCRRFLPDKGICRVAIDVTGAHWDREEGFPSPSMTDHEVISAKHWTRNRQPDLADESWGGAAKDESAHRRVDTVGADDYIYSLVEPSLKVARAGLSRHRLYGGAELNGRVVAQQLVGSSSPHAEAMSPSELRQRDLQELFARGG